MGTAITGSIVGRAAAKLVVAGALLGTLSLGCDRRSDHPAITPPATAPAVAVAMPRPSRPATRPAATLTVDGRSMAFPAARLVLSKKSDGLDAILCSDDPPTAIESSYLGNSFFFEMRLDVDDPADLGGAVWTFKVPDRQAEDSPNGIFLSGDRRQLQPADVRVVFHRQGDQMVANLAGRFLARDPQDPERAARSVDVAGSLAAAVQLQ